MITNNTIGYCGRLGNQLFQYAILKVIALKNNYDILLPANLHSREWHGQMCMLKHFKLPSCTFGDSTIEYQYTELDPRYYDRDIYNLPNNTNLTGFFQNPAYYTDYRNELCKEFELRDEIVYAVSELYDIGVRPTVSMHIRRGDLADGSTGNAKDVAWSNDHSEKSTLMKYYRNALDNVPQESVIFLFTGGSRDGISNKADVDWCKKYFNDSRIRVVTNLNDIETFALMTMCNYNITSFASTFSWWASFLNKNQNIIAPKIYYPSYPEMTPDLVYPDNWTLI